MNQNPSQNFPSMQPCLEASSHPQKPLPLDEMERKVVGHGKNIKGLRFGSIVAIKPLPARNKRMNVMWECLCDCGKTSAKIVVNLLGGKTTSCGCAFKKINITHGLSRSKVHRAWGSMKDRCTNPNCGKYHCYGGRGITFSKEWESFDCFLKDMGFPPSPKHSIERIDNNKGYSKENCVWATHKAQSNNKRTNVRIEWRGVTRVLKDWSEITGLNSRVISGRLRHGWSIEDALTKPLRITSRSLVCES